MIVLGIETSCDETSLSLIDANQERGLTRMTGVAAVSARIRVLADRTLSQIELHREYGGVFPNMAKREHSRTLIPLLKTVLLESNLISHSPHCLISNSAEEIKEILGKEPELRAQFLEYIPTVQRPPIDAIAVTVGPGLEPCLWTGINLAKALSLAWDVPVMPVNHMEGHIFSALLRRKDVETFNYELLTFNFPALALLISGGHTELVLIRDWFEYEIIGQTRDDAVGEAFDKVARLLGLPYPGGPPLSALAAAARTDADFTQTNAETGQRMSAYSRRESAVSLPRPMLKSDTLDFSFSGLKTAVLYLIQKLTQTDAVSVRAGLRPVRVSPRVQSLIAREFEDAITEVLVSKTKRAIEQYGVKTLLIGGGVIANTHIRNAFEKVANTYGRKYLPRNEFLHIPEPELATDNALMIAVTGFLRLFLKNALKKARNRELTAKGNLRLDRKYGVC